MNRFYLLVAGILFGQWVHSQSVQPVTKSENHTLNLNLIGGKGILGSDATLYGFQTTFDFEKQERFLTGIGTGIEVQRTDSFTVYAIPVFLNAQIILMGQKSESIYAFFKPGISLAYQAELSIRLDSVNHPTLSGRKAESAYDLLSNGFFIQAGFGYEAQAGIHVEFFYRSQPSNLLTQFQTRNSYFGIALGYRIR